MQLGTNGRTEQQNTTHSEVTSFSFAVAVDRQLNLDNLMLSVNLQVVHRALSCPQRIFVIYLQWNV